MFLLLASVESVNTMLRKACETPVFFIVADAVAGEFTSLVEQLRALSQASFLGLCVVVAVCRENTATSAQ